MCKGMSDHWWRQTVGGAVWCAGAQGGTGEGQGERSEAREEVGLAHGETSYVRLAREQRAVGSYVF